MAREKSTHLMSNGQRMGLLPLDEDVNEQLDRRQDNVVSMIWGQRITANPIYPQRIDKRVDPPGHISANQVRRNGQESFGADQQRGQNTDVEIQQQYVDPQATAQLPPHLPFSVHGQLQSPPAQAQLSGAASL